MMQVQGYGVRINRNPVFFIFTRVIILVTVIVILLPVI